MRFNKLDLNLLVALDALLSECSISRAADKLHLSQSAMSSALGRLRMYFDDELLVPVGRRMEPTSRAEALKDAVRDILVRIDSTVSMQPDFVPSESDRGFSLLVSDYTMATLVPHLLALAYRQGPALRFDLRPQGSHPQRALERGEADLLIIPTDYCLADHPAEPVFEDGFQCVIWNESPLASGELTAERYLAAGHVVVHPGEARSSLEDWFMQRIAVTRRIEATTFSFMSSAHLVVGTDRIATVHGRLARQALSSLPVLVRDVPFALPVMVQTMQWHTHRTSDPGLRWLRALVKEAARQMDRS